MIELVEETATIARLTAARQMSQFFSLLYIRKKSSWITDGNREPVLEENWFQVVQFFGVVRLPAY